MRYKVPISLKDRRRYVCLRTGLSKAKLSELLVESIREISGALGVGIHYPRIIRISGDLKLVRTTEGSVPMILTAILHMVYVRGIDLDVLGISGTIRASKESCLD